MAKNSSHHRALNSDSLDTLDEKAKIQTTMHIWQEMPAIIHTMNTS